jgi:tetratricopeptide (TPR) repeat protein
MRHTGRIAFFLGLALLAPGMCAAQPAPRNNPTTSVTASDRFQELRQNGFDALYNLDYDGARKQFREIARLYPDHPAGPQFLAAALYGDTLNKSRRLQANLYNSDSFYSKKDDQIDPKVAEEFKSLIAQARRLAQVRLKEDPKNVEALYFLGAADGLKAAFEASVQRSFLSALRDGKSSVDRHREVMKLDPTYYDAELTIGLYDYVLGSLPLPVKLMASLTGARGSKRRGLETLNRVAQQGHWVQDDAKFVLIALYKREKRFNDALAISRALSQKYPRNYLFKLESADALISQAALEKVTNPSAAAKEQREAIEIFEGLLRDKTTREVAAKSMDQIHFRYGEVLFTAGLNEQASREFTTAATIPNAEPGLATMSLLKAGQALDLMGRRGDAVEKYKTVLTRPDVYNAHDEAREGLKRPYSLPQENKSTSSSVSDTGTAVHSELH